MHRPVKIEEAFEIGVQMILGKNGKWMWLSSKAACMGDLVEKCSQILIDKFVLITSLDSGSYRLDDELIKSGWKYVGKDADDNEEEFALSPRITNPSILPRVHYDEWYVFNSPPKLETVEVFINLVDFGFSIGHVGLHKMESCTFEERFWDQLNVINPFAYIADNGTLLFATFDGNLYEQVVLAVQDEERAVETACDARSTLGEI
jgi:hypothetical protein